MKVSVDGGSLCASKNRQYGNYRFSYDLLTSLSKFDNHNSYNIYTFCNQLPELNEDRFKFRQLTPSWGFMPYRVGMAEITKKSDIFLALNQSIPIFTKGKVVAFSHGLAFYYFSKLYSEAIAMLNNQLKAMLRKADLIIVSSSKVKKEFNEIAPDFRNVVVIPFGISQDLLTIDKKRQKDKFLMYVGMDHPIKQIDLIVIIFLSAKRKTNRNDWKLLLVGVSKKYENKDLSIFVEPFLECDQLIKLYQKTSGLITSSLYESFNLPVLEALCCGAPVVGLKSAVIPELQKYVIVAKNSEEFESKICLLMTNSLPPKPKINKKLFSWENYVKKLTSLY